MENVEEVLPGKRRKWLFKKLERIMNRIENFELPMYISEVYLFGSFLKEKDSPTDIDIILIYDSNKTAEMYEVVDSKGNLKWKMWDLRRSPSRLRGMLKYNSERTVHLNIVPSLQAFQKDLEYEMDVWLKIWDVNDRDWHGKLIKYFSDFHRSKLRTQS